MLVHTEQFSKFQAESQYLDIIDSALGVLRVNMSGLSLFSSRSCRNRARLWVYGGKMDNKCSGDYTPVLQLLTGSNTWPMRKRNWLDGVWLDISCVMVATACFWSFFSAVRCFCAWWSCPRCRWSLSSSLTIWLLTQSLTALMKASRPVSLEEVSEFIIVAAAFASLLTCLFLGTPVCPGNHPMVVCRRGFSLCKCAVCPGSETWYQAPPPGYWGRWLLVLREPMQ